MGMERDRETDVWLWVSPAPGPLAMSGQVFIERGSDTMPTGALGQYQCCPVVGCVGNPTGHPGIPPCIGILKTDPTSVGQSRGWRPSGEGGRVWEFQASPAGCFRASGSHTGVTHASVWTSSRTQLPSKGHCGHGAVLRGGCSASPRLPCSDCRPHTTGGGKSTCISLPSPYLSPGPV